LTNANKSQRKRSPVTTTIELEGVTDSYALGLSPTDEVKERERSIQACAKSIAVLRSRMDRAYEDMLDGKIESEFFDRKSREWRSEQAILQERLEALRQEDRGYQEMGRLSLEFSLYSSMIFTCGNSSQKRRLLEILISNASWKEGSLTVTLKEPFETLRVTKMGSSSRRGAPCPA